MHPLEMLDHFAPTTTGAVSKFERRFGHRLPDDYRRFLISTNGGLPAHPVFDVPALAPKARRAVDFFHGLGAPYQGCDLMIALEYHSDHLPDGVLVIAKTTGSSSLCLDLRKGRNALGYWHNRTFPLDPKWREQDFLQVSVSFEEFLAKREPEPPRRTRLARRAGKIRLPRLSKIYKPATVDQLSKFESKIGFTLPELYKDPL